MLERDETKKAVLLASLVLVSMPALAGSVAETDGYRMDDFRAPVPATLSGATVVSTKGAARLWRRKEALFVDVMPDTPKPANLPKGTIWRDKVRQDIPGSIWLANVGYGALSKETAAYFADGLAGHVKEKTSKIVFYCMTNCWMSWNAAKRALELGYRDVVWYPGGADGWEKEGLPVAENRPFGKED